MDFLDDIIQLIDDAISDDADIVITSGNIIKAGYNSEVDIQRKVIEESEAWISEYQKRLIHETSIQTLKIKFSSAQGYFIEIPHSQNSKILSSFIPRQSLTSVSRYTSIELREFESKLQIANSELYEREYNIFLHIRNTIQGHYNNIYTISRNISHLDFLGNGAYISLLHGYNTPKITSHYTLDIDGGKHPVISLSERDFISNSLNLNAKNYIHVITGPNMGGKSTYLRQNALLILMSHVGYDIPCRSAEIGLIDQIFSRVGAGDNLYLGQSTFMVEMQEISYILRHSTKKSFVIIDEIGRGTSTYDGMSLAWSILEHNQKRIGAKTLFATHYHEIIDYAENLNGVSNASVSVGENESNIVFLRKIIPGGIKKSYGIEVAALAGMPQEVLGNARKRMSELTQKHQNTQLQIPEYSLLGDNIKNNQNSRDKSQGIILKLKNLDLERISPIECLQKISEIQQEIKEI